MICIDETLAQLYVDNEVDTATKVAIDKHVLICKDCAQKIDEQRSLSTLIKEEINTLSNAPANIPNFASISSKLNNNKKQNLSRLIFAASAACVIAFCLIFFLRKPEEKQQLVYYYKIEFNEFDANKPYTEQEASIIIFDENGKIYNH
ncbi:zf-HC2 domain-containing protein [Odoribacter sp. OttesenSCG-928-L07]|nr:zf-HC2 domain-containing protein [Odoribacter sp. OttesenSCG-928-L07]MDL2239775.1 zf-HC2 domain-containing protein [Bacteroidales bacterium OttesenSCG-928-L14]